MTELTPKQSKVLKTLAKLGGYVEFGGSKDFPTQTVTSLETRGLVTWDMSGVKITEAGKQAIA
jgi:Mn-dependent DtxR family transcriptional regulator